MSLLSIWPGKGSARHAGSSPRLQAGSSLLEVLVAILLMSFAMLSLAAMQAYSVAAHQNAAHRAMAASLADELAELMRLNPAGVAAGSYDVSMLANASPPPLVDCRFPSCNTASILAESDTTAFLQRARVQLPAGGVQVERPPATGQVHLWIMWMEPAVFTPAQNKSGGKAAVDGSGDNCPASAKTLPVMPRCFYAKVQL